MRWIVLTAAVASGAFAEAPVAEVRPLTENYHGVPVVDPYRYMEDLKSPEVAQWIKGQAEHAKKVLEAIPGRDRMLARIQELDSGTPYRLWVVRRWPNGDLHYLKALASENLEKLYFRDAKSGVEKLLIDPEQFRHGGQHASLAFCRPSPDGRFIAYGVALAGSEQTTLRLLEVATGRDLPQTIDRLESDYTAPCWLDDSSGFVYSRRRALPAGAPATEVYKQTYASLHRLGARVEEDPVVLARGLSPQVSMSESDFPSIVLVRGCRYAIGKIKHGDANEVTLYAATVESLIKGAPAWKKVCDAADEVRDFALHDETIDLLTSKEAPRFKVVRTSLAAPDFAKATTVIEQGRGVIQSLHAARDGLYVGVLDGGLATIVRMPFDGGAASAVALPEGMPSGHATAVSNDVEGVLVATQSWTQRGKLFAYDPRNATMTDTGLWPRGASDDLPGMTSRQVMVTSHDGVKVPLTIICAKDLKLDGSHPTLVSGYGGYGMVMSPHFNAVSMAWLERGGVLAYAHVRGGGEFGKEWHHAGQKANKPNTWKDFIACCEYLVNQRYASPGRLAGQGGSAGGILIGRAITQRPDLFAAAVIQVGCTDMLRMETTTNGVPNIAEFGTVKTPEGFRGLLQMSAYHQVKDGVKYPAVLLTHGINDPRVEPWMSAKMTARLQAATASGRPVLFRVEYSAGHGIGSTRAQRQAETADRYAFLLWQMRVSLPAASAP